MAEDYKLLMSILAKNMTEGADERSVPPAPTPSPQRKPPQGKFKYNLVWTKSRVNFSSAHVV